MTDHYCEGEASWRLSRPVPLGQAGEILEAEPGQLAAGQLADVDDHFFLGARR